MFHHLKKIFPFPSGQSQWYRLGFLLVLLSITYLVSGCSSTTSQELYENSEFGISLDKPGNWSLEFYERNRSIVLEAETGIWNKDSVLIVIQGIAVSPLLYDSKQELEANIDKIHTLYNLDSVTVIQEPTIIEGEAYEMATATILIPTMSIPEDSTANQVGVQDPNVFQTVDMRTIKCPGNFALIYVYEGNSEQLNAEAEAIVDSIELTCAAEP